jgi:hypothetical protein
MQEFSVTRMAVLGGSFCCFVGIRSPDLLRTVVLSVIGTVVSFLISLLLKKWLKK